ncbi:hypothetical protein DSLASN_43810 [Desulfoluna limicola]|uniref:Uncharacterized protein n=1 Tax=Desulfoluna limicola TaxID=2810562 RepID=A0ABM7PMQ5_9BACT|nr:hypothetical protein DSLASN_43810 [Desulfoluna limicola]
MPKWLRHPCTPGSQMLQPSYLGLSHLLTGYAREQLLRFLNLFVQLEGRVMIFVVYTKTNLLPNMMSWV